MYCTLSKQIKKMQHNEQICLLIVLPLCSNYVILFYNDGSFYHYSLLEDRSLFQSKLQGTPYKAISISKNRILVSIIQSKSVLLLDTHLHNIFLIKKIPSEPVSNQLKARQIFFQTQLEYFNKSGSFYIFQKNSDKKTVKISYSKQDDRIDKDNFSIRQLCIKDSIVQKLDQEDKIVLYKQSIQTNSILNIQIYNLSNNEKQINYKLQHQYFNLYSVIRSIKKIDNNRFIIIINNHKTQILIFNEVQCLEYIENKKIFLNVLTINIQIGYGIFMYLSQNNRELHTIDIINLKNGKTIDSKDFTIYEIKQSKLGKYFVNYRKQIEHNTISTFNIINIIDKYAHYRYLLESFDFLESNIKEQVLNLL